MGSIKICLKTIFPVFVLVDVWPRTEIMLFFIHPPLMAPLITILPCAWPYIKKQKTTKFFSPSGAIINTILPLAGLYQKTISDRTVHTTLPKQSCYYRCFTILPSRSQLTFFGPQVDFFQKITKIIVQLKRGNPTSRITFLPFPGPGLLFFGLELTFFRKS